MNITKKMAEEITDMANLNQWIQDKIWSYMKLSKKHRNCALLADNIIGEVMDVSKNKTIEEFLIEPLEGMKKFANVQEYKHKMRIDKDNKKYYIEIKVKEYK